MTSKSEIYAAITEIDDSLEEYRKSAVIERWSTGKPEPMKEYELFLEELEIDPVAIARVATSVALGVMGTLKTISDSAGETEFDVFGARHGIRQSAKEALAKISDNKDPLTLTFLTTVWTEGFVIGMIVNEMAGKTWDKINEGAFSRLMTKNPKPSHFFRKEGSKWQYDKSSLDDTVYPIAVNRVSMLYHKILGKVTPVQLTGTTKRVVQMAAKVLCHGIESAKEVDFKV